MHVVAASCIRRVCVCVCVCPYCRTGSTRCRFDVITYSKSPAFRTTLLPQNGRGIHNKTAKQGEQTWQGSRLCITNATKITDILSNYHMTAITESYVAERSILLLKYSSITALSKASLSDFSKNTRTMTLLPRWLKRLHLCLGECYKVPHAAGSVAKPRPQSDLVHFKL